MKFKFLPHTADIKFQAFGESYEEVFENAGLALTKIICEERIKTQTKKKIKIKGRDLENLLYNFLEEFLFLFETEGFILSRVEKIKITGNNLVCEVVGDVEEHEIGNHVKAITYHEMFVKKQREKYFCQVVVDV